MSECDHKGRKCINSRAREEFRYRRYECPKCNSRYSTIEIIIEDIDLLGKNAINVATGQLMKRIADDLISPGCARKYKL